ncbi:MAG: patatin-like phospholipase family protein, partial [Hyphomonadaceae bacterium]
MADTATLPALTAPRRKRSPRAPVQTKTINLALQGGGAHGAFAWGVLDRLLEDERIGFDGVSATSAGAMNAAVMAYGLT